MAKSSKPTPRKPKPKPSTRTTKVLHDPRPLEKRPSKRRGGRASRQKGNRSERALVRYLQERGFAAERVPLSAFVRGCFGGDISVPLLGIDRRVESEMPRQWFRPALRLA
jgi:hypothetical protein